MALTAASAILAGFAPIAYTLAGAVGIGFAALFFRKHHGRVRHIHHYGHSHNHHGHSHSQHGHGQSHGHHIPDHTYHRQKRSVDEDERIGRLLEVVRAEDLTGCGFRLVCELAGIPEDQLTEEEASILSLIGPPIKPGEGILPKAARAEYQFARGYGESGFNCGQIFLKCPLNGSQLMTSINNLIP